MSFPSYSIQNPNGVLVPLVLSIPHAGTGLPIDIAGSLRDEIISTLPDTDWFIVELYDFCAEMGIPIISAEFSRYVIDLNRPVEGISLYTDQRRQTDALPITTFDGDPLYLDGKVPDAIERQRRIELYYRPYHTALRQLLVATRQKFGQVLLFDAHSIRREVPSLATEAFADFIVGDRDGSSAAAILSQTLVASLGKKFFQVRHNQPFKGGQITRIYGNPSQGMHALQLEMSQDIYLTDDRQGLEAKRVAKLRPVLKQALRNLIQQMEKL